jgi:predicted acetyltransferase
MHELYLKYDEMMPIGVKGYWGDLCPQTFADIMYWTGENDADINNEEDEGTWIGTISWATYNQALAMVHDVNMTHVPFLMMQNGRKEALLDLDYTLISQETINETGAASNPNIVVLIHFGISAAFRNKGLGEEVLKGFIEQMKGKCGYVVIVNNTPAQCDPNSLYPLKGIELDGLEKDPEKAQWKLNAFWQRCGFRQFKNYDNVFICNVDQAVAEQQKAKATAV